MATSILRSNTYGHLVIDTLEQFEKEIGTTLPEDYRAFLIEHNGGTPQPACFMVTDDPFEENSEKYEREVVCFFALHFNIWNDSSQEGSLAFPLHKAYKDLKSEQDGLEILPIGKDWSGSYICVGYGANNRGEIFFYHHEYEVATSLSPSFVQFLAVLQPCQTTDS